MNLEFLIFTSDLNIRYSDPGISSDLCTYTLLYLSNVSHMLLIYLTVLNYEFHSSQWCFSVGLDILRKCCKCTLQPSIMFHILRMFCFLPQTQEFLSVFFTDTSQHLTVCLAQSTYLKSNCWKVSDVLKTRRIISNAGNVWIALDQEGHDLEQEKRKVKACSPDLLGAKPAADLGVGVTRMLILKLEVTSSGNDHISFLCS